MDLVLGIGTLIFVYVLAMWGRPAARGDESTATTTTASASARRRWQLSIDSIPEEDEGCQSDPAECLDDSEDDESEPTPVWNTVLRLSSPVLAGV